MTIADRPQQDSEDPTTIMWWADYTREDLGSAGSYLFERGDDLEITDFTVETADYTSVDAHRAEAERLWPRAWIWACRENDIPAVGDYLEFDIAGRSVVIVRSDRGEVVAFNNACRHRGTAIVAGHGNASCFSCPYHGWTYSTDGSLLDVPAAWDFDYLDPARAGLVPVQAATFDGWVFINLDRDAEPFEEYLGATLTRHFLTAPSAGMWKKWHYGAVVGSNWKIMTEAFMETYHVARTHPELISYSCDIQAQYDAFGLHHRVIAFAGVHSLVGGAEFTEQEIIDSAFGASRPRYSQDSGSAGAPQLPEGMTARQFMAAAARDRMKQLGLDESEICDTELIDAPLYFVFPNTMIFRNAAGHHVYRFRPSADNPNSCIFEVMQLVPMAAGEECQPDRPLVMLDPEEKFVEHMDEIGILSLYIDQDLTNSPRIQKGIRGLERLNLAKEQEKLILNFHRNLRKFMG